MNGMMRSMVIAAMPLAGCTIADVTVAPGEDRLVVEAVLRTDARSQVILLHRSVQDGVAQGERGAEVVVTRGDGVAVVFQESVAQCYGIDPVYFVADDPVDFRGTCYVSPPKAGLWVQPGATYDLSVRTAGGEEARGRTVVPGNFELVGVPMSLVDDEEPLACAVPPRTPFPLTWTQSAGAWGYIAPLRIQGLSAVPNLQAPDPLQLVGVSVSAADTSLVLPGEFGVFDRFSFHQDLLVLLQAGLPELATAQVVVAAADRNYINGVRGGSFNPSGPVRVSSVVGDGVGVFGSLVPLAASIVVGPVRFNRPSCIG